MNNKKASPERRLLIIDGNWVFGSAYFSKVPRSGVVDSAIMKVKRFTKRGRYTHMVIVFDSSGQRRRSVYPKYKEKRKKKDPDYYEYIEIFKKRISRIIKSIEMQGEEADDVIGSLCNKFRNIQKDIMTGDGDFLQLVNNKTRIVRVENKKLININESTIKSFTPLGLKSRNYLEYKIMMGDKADNVKSITGMNPGIVLKVLRGYNNYIHFATEMIKVNRRHEKSRDKRKRKYAKDKIAHYTKGIETYRLNKFLVTIYKGLYITLTLEDMERWGVGNEYVKRI